jgi:hypothetical protein
LNRFLGRRLLWKAVLSGAVATLLTLVAVNSHEAKSAPTRAACGSELWSLKTLSDPLRRRVNLHPRATTIAAINARPMPVRAPTRRDAFERQVWRVSAQIVEYKLEDDQDIHLVLYGAGAYLIAEMPAASCLPRRTRDRRAIVRVRRFFETGCGAATNSWHQLGAPSLTSAVSASGTSRTAKVVRRATPPSSIR